MELNDSEESIWVIKDIENLGHSYRGGYAKKCVTNTRTLDCPDGTFAKEIEWDTKFEMTKGIKMSCYRPEHYQSDENALESHPGVQFEGSEKRKCAAIHGLNFKINDEKIANVGLNLTEDCTAGFGDGIKSSCPDKSVVSGIDVFIEEKCK